MKLFLYSFAFSLSDEQAKALTDLTGKKPEDISLAVIDNAADAVPDSANWVKDTHTILESKGYTTEIVNLKDWQNDKVGLRETLTRSDVIWVNAGNTYYLRWIMRQTGADEIIIDLVKQGKVYAGWSAGAIVAGPTLLHIEHMEDVSAAPEVIPEGLQLTDIVVVPHMDNPDFSEAAKKTNEALQAAGYITQPLTDAEALVIDGDSRHVI
jgi:dipeptidase E